MCAQACPVRVHMCAHLCVYLGVCVDVCKLACACVCEYACNKGCCISSVSFMSITTGHISEAFMVTLRTQQQHSSNNNNTATATSNECPMNRGVRVGAASITDEPEKTSAMIKPDPLPTTHYLLSYYLLILTTYYRPNRQNQPIVMPTRNAHFFGLGSPNHQILVRNLRRQIRQGRCGRAARDRPNVYPVPARPSFSSSVWRPKFHRVS